jgi:hypothetical protein
MVDIVNLLVNNGIAVVVVGYFLYTNYKFNDKLTSTLTEITVTLKDIQDDLKGAKNENIRHKETD